jgi:hypothetical protein
MKGAEMTTHERQALGLTMEQVQTVLDEALETK